MKSEKCVIQLNGSDDGLQEKKIENNEDEIDIKHKISDFGAVLHIIKSSLGSGLLATPFAFKNGGTVVSLIGTVLVGFIIIHTTAMIIDCAQGLCQIYNKKRLSYADTAEYAFLYGFKGKLKNHASKARLWANFFLFVTYYGINVCYVLIIAKTFKQVLEKHFEIEYGLRWYTVGTLFLIYPVSIIRWMKFLVPFSALANTFLMVGMGMVFWEILQKLPSISSRPAAVSFDHWPVFFSTIFMAMEGVGIVMPVENEMKNPRRLTNKPGLLYYGLAVVIVLNTALGFFGYIKYGADCEPTVSLNLSDNWVSEVVKMTIALAILFSFGLQLSISIKVVWDNVKISSNTDDGILYYVIRSLLIIGAVIIPTTAPSLKGFMVLIGSIGFPMLGLFCPAVMELAYLSTSRSGFFRWYIIKDIALIILSLSVSIVGSYCSIVEILESG